jgi:dephospho-CoA kinase
MLRVGLTGGIGSGKSTVAQRFSELGAVVIDADQLAREVVAPGSPGLAEIAARFGDDVLDDGGGLNRPALGALVFADPDARHALEQITHPRIARRTAELIAAAPDDAVVVHDVPLLAEKHLGPGYHLVVVVGATEQTRVKRLMHMRGMTEDDARSRIAAQATDEQRRAAADVWLDNDGSRQELLAQVDTLWHHRVVGFERNVRTGTRSHRPEELQLASPDPTWPQQANRLIGRLRLACGDVAVTADHVGSTAISGMAAKDVIDIQIGVPSLAAADDDALLARLRAAGFPRVDGIYSDTQRFGDGPRPKRLHGHGDPARVAHIHLREVGSPGWRWDLMFRDWMRDDEQAAGEYAAQKRRIAATGATTSEYAEAKESWFDAIAARAEQWAERTGWEPQRG